VRFPTARRVLEDALAERAFPAAVIEVGRQTGPVWTEPFGTLSLEPSPATLPETVFDLASLTKVIATSSIAMQLMEGPRLTPDTPLSTLLPEWTDRTRTPILVRHLLDHSAGLPATAPLWQAATSRLEFIEAIRALPVEQEPGSVSVYSDLGFILLGFALEEAAGESLDAQFRRLADALALGDITYLPPASWRLRTAPTEFDESRGRMLVGEVHDENAGALGGVAGHAGLFGTAAAVGRFAQVVLRTFRSTTLLGSPGMMRRMAAPTGVPGSSRALGWDTMLPTSSCGTRLSPTAIGHTGFTGTSLWIDWERDTYVVLLTNRVHPTRANGRLTAVRPLVHDAVAADLGW
jgi:CubicO group peptidase (beta-lactamase class C family)